jgi:hypothetical protein
MSDQASPSTVPPIMALDRWYFDHMGRAALDLRTHPRPALSLIEGDRRAFFDDRTPGAATLTTIQGGKETSP